MVFNCPPLCSSGQEFLVQIHWSGFDSRRYQIFWEVVGLERGPLSLVSTTEALLGRKSSGSGLESRDYGRRGSAALTTRHPSIRKRWHFADTDGRSVGIVRSRTQATEFCFVCNDVQLPPSTYSSTQCSNQLLPLPRKFKRRFHVHI
jgi:hypothetical protein